MVRRRRDLGTAGTQLSLHRASFLWAAWCFVGALALIGGFLLARGVSTPGDSADVVSGSILCPLSLLLAFFALLDSRATVVVSSSQVRLRRGLVGWWRLGVDEVVYVELLVPGVRLGGGAGVHPALGFWPPRWRMVVWRVDGMAVIANRYGLGPDPREGWGPVDLRQVVQAIRGAQGPGGRYGLPGAVTRRAIEEFPVRGRWPQRPFVEEAAKEH